MTLNIPQAITTALLLVGSATGMVFADDLGLPPIPGMRASSGSAQDDCPPADGEDGAVGDEDNADGNSTEASNETADDGDGNETTGPDGNETAGPDGNATAGEGEGNGTAGAEGDGDAEPQDEDEADAEPESDCAEEPAPDGNETAEDGGNETAEPEQNETAEPEQQAALVEDKGADCSFGIDEWGDDTLPADRDWEWLVTPSVDRLTVRFEAHQGLPGLGSGPEIRLIDGSGRILASSDSGEGYGGLQVDLERGDYMAPGLWRLTYESDATLSSYYVFVEVDC